MRTRPAMASAMSRNKIVRVLLVSKFHDADTDGDGRIDHVQLRDMLRQILDGYADDVCLTAGDVRAVMSYCDKKHDDTTLLEFELVGAIMRTVDSLSDTSSAPADNDCQAILQLVASSLVSYVELMAVLLHVSFRKASGESDAIDPEGLCELFKCVLRNETDWPSVPEAKLFLDWVDQSGSGSVSEVDFLRFMLNGMCMPKKKLKKFKRRSEMHRKIYKFVSLCKRQLGPKLRSAVIHTRDTMDRDELAVILSYIT